MNATSVSGPQGPRGVYRPALVIGHPGHELKVFGWMSEQKPRVYAITDGSGRHGVSRTSSTATLLAGLRAPRGELFGCISDAEMYRAILEQRLPVFYRMVDQLAASFLTHQIDCVAGDAAEGFNPTHDLCRGLINSAVLLTQRMTGSEILNLEFSLTEWEQGCTGMAHDGRCLHWILNDRALAKKMAAAGQYAELKEEVRRAVAQCGEEYFRTECLRRSAGAGWPDMCTGMPAYETWGEQRVGEGQYQTVIRFKEHILPILNALRDHAAHAALNALGASRPSGFVGGPS